MNFDQAFKEGLKNARILRGWSQEQLAEAARVNRVTVSQIESGQRPASRDAQWKLAEALGVTPEQIMGVAPRPLAEEVPQWVKPLLPKLALVKERDQEILRALLEIIVK
jgi:transcriptional regulator with XRE-family HTH domain